MIFFRTVARHSMFGLGLMTVLMCSTNTALAGQDDNNTLRTRTEALGQLNGVALACKQFALSRRVKDFIIDEAPKERELAEWFEQATHQAFLDHGNQKAVCPDSRRLAAQIENATSALKSSLPGKLQ